MTSSRIPERASIEFLKKLAKERLVQLRQRDPQATLSIALFEVAKDHGFASWRALKAELDSRQAQRADRFFRACETDDIASLNELIALDPELVHTCIGDSSRIIRRGTTGLHLATRHGHANAVRLLLDHGADPNARENGDNACALHFAAGAVYLDCVTLLLAADGDVHGYGDAHEMEGIGWTTVLHSSDIVHADVLATLLDHGARHHVFSAIALGETDVIQRLADDNPRSVDRRMSRFEHRQTALQFAVARRRHEIVELLLELGAETDVQDTRGRTALDMARLGGDHIAMQLLHAAGVNPPSSSLPASGVEIATYASSVKRMAVSLSVADVAKTLSWYLSIGFKETGRHVDDGVLNWASVSFGATTLMFNARAVSQAGDVGIWIYVDDVAPIYRLLKARQFSAAQSVLDGRQADVDAGEFIEDLYHPFYGGQQFSIRDLDGHALVFYSG